MAKKTTKLVASSKAIDPTLDALFASSSGPVQAPTKSRYAASIEKKPRHESMPGREASTNGDEESEEKDDEELSEISEELDYDEDEDEDNESKLDDEQVEKPGDISMVNVDQQDDAETAEEQQTQRQRKRKRKDDNDDLEAKYLADLTKHDTKEPYGKRQKADTDAVEQEETGDDANPTHESLSRESKDADVDVDIEKANRTVFLSNVSIDAISSKSAKRTLIAHLSSALDPNETPAQKFETIRFRSLAFSTGSMPKRAAFITKSLMGATTKSANAYAVFSTPAAARLVAAKLNGSEVLGRHIRVDSVAHPSPTDHRRCVFVGNLGFVDDETVVSTNEDGETVEKKRTKVPADAEEGLWRTFDKAGKVENVRVVRDPKTRVGKGIAYVQFYDANDVEAALLLDGKKFPPLLPRVLRVARAKDPRKTALAQERSRSKAQAAERQAHSTKYTPKQTPEQQAAAGRANKLLGRAGGFQHRNKASHATKPSSANRDPSQKLVFEGNRASINDGRPRDLKFRKGKGRSKPKPKNRSARRAADWKKKS
ncbi:hypothetical protein E4U42_002389 [Claviceps africana]|uniref:Nucleolar protein 12 n=1 Tax=Claviceps africana TaxID=83212 RepID=A0A8K0J8T4_9HYPO|nr:hypothetical protein E4U42_002389 [Claviceps africana]